MSVSYGIGPSGNEITSEDLDGSYALGIISGLDTAAELILEEATQLWANKNDPIAVRFRDLSDQIHTKSKVERAKYEKRYKK